MLASEMMESKVNIRFLSVQQQFLYQHFWLNQQLGLSYSATYDFA